MLFIAPWLLGCLVFLVFPLGFSLYMSFHSVQILPTRIATKFVGFDYYREILFSSSVLYENLFPFLREMAVMIPVILVFALMIAIFLNQRFWGRSFFRAVFFLPVIFTTGYVVTEFVNQGQGSLGFLENARFSGYLDMFLGSGGWGEAVKNVLNRFVLILWYSGVQILIFLAGRQTISPSAYEAARIDGASPWDVFWKITLPAMTPFLFLNLIYTVIDMFTFPFNPIIQLIAMKNYGYNSALAWIYFVIILIVLGLFVALFARIVRSRPKME
ncbi:carbohydrate ABC transporter permease [Cohnella sp. 56]|uniref:carbohydrate ABC transporter permease n=1 Tax=Cohnella sp. 56 TaxID=3113722 RepID=UPI0030E7A2AB